MKLGVEHFLKIFDEVPLGLSIVDLDYRYRWINPAFCQMLGYSAEELVGRTFVDLTHPDDLEVNLENTRRLLEGSIPHFRLEKRYIRKDGEIFWAALSVTLLQNDDDSPTHFLGMLENIQARKQAEEELLRRNRELTLLNRVIAAAASSLDPQTVLHTTLRELANGLDLLQGGAALLDESETQLTVVAEYLQENRHSALGARIPIAGNPSTQYVLEQRLPLAIAEAQSDPRLSPLHGLMQQRGVASLLLLPILIHGRAVGTLGLDSFTPREFSPEEISLAASATAAAAQAIELARLHAEVQRLAITDDVTGLYNRHGLFELGAREVERALRYNRPLSAIMLDVDGFKAINDDNGHTAGDQVLQAIGQGCARRLREVDLLSRYGGDEFVFLLPESDLRTARLAAERLRGGIAGQPIQTVKGPLNVTASLGLAQADLTTPDLNALIDRADAAMYAAKRAGRNRVMTLA